MSVRKNISTVLLSCFIAVCLTLLALPAPAQAVTSAEKQAEADALMNSLNGLQDQLNQATDTYNEAVRAHDDAIAAMDAAQARIDDANARIADYQSRLGSRANSMYKQGNASFLEVLLGATSFEAFVENWDFLNKMNDSDAQLVLETKVARQEASDAHAEYTAQEKIAAEQETAAEQAQRDLAARTSDMQSQVDAINAEVAQLLAEEEAAASAAQAAAAAAAASSGSSGSAGRPVESGSGIFTHPCPGYSSISSTFGYRSFDNAFHKGVDFAAAAGTPIYAADSGTVVIAGYSSSAGNWVVISHGNGVTTKYMHMLQTPYVSAGQTVNRGDNIGIVGSTGNSTGPHLHFQVEVNGAAVDPMAYL